MQRDVELEKDIDAYIKGNLTDEEARTLWIELLKKPEYISLLQAEINLSRYYRNSHVKNATILNWKWILSVAATVLIILMSIGSFYPQQELKPLDSFTESHIDMAHYMASAEVSRSAVPSTPLMPADSLLNAGFEAALSQHIPQAEERFNEIIEQFPETTAAAKAYLNLGIMEYNAGNYRQSAAHFEHTIRFVGDDTFLAERSYWYLSNALLRQGSFEAARDAAANAYQLGKLYKRASFVLLKHIDYELGTIDYDDLQESLEESG